MKKNSQRIKKILELTRLENFQLICADEKTQVRRGLISAVSASNVCILLMSYNVVKLCLT